MAIFQGIWLGWQAPRSNTGLGGGASYGQEMVKEGKEERGSGSVKKKPGGQFCTVVGLSNPVALPCRRVARGGCGAAPGPTPVSSPGRIASHNGHPIGGCGHAGLCGSGGTRQSCCCTHHFNGVAGMDCVLHTDTLFCGQLSCVYLCECDNRIRVVYEGVCASILHTLLAKYLSRAAAAAISKRRCPNQCPMVHNVGLSMFHIVVVSPFKQPTSASGFVWICNLQLTARGSLDR